MKSKRYSVIVAFMVWLLVIACTLTNGLTASSLPTISMPQPTLWTVNENTSTPAITSTISQNCRVITHVNDGQLNLRSGPGTQYAVIIVLHEGDPIQVSTSSADWLFANVNGYSGWVSRYFIACNSKGD